MSKLDNATVLRLMAKARAADTNSPKPWGGHAKGGILAACVFENDWGVIVYAGTGRLSQPRHMTRWYESVEIATGEAVKASFGPWITKKAHPTLLQIGLQHKDDNYVHHVTSAMLKDILDISRTTPKPPSEVCWNKRRLIGHHIAHAASAFVQGIQLQLTTPDLYREADVEDLWALIDHLAEHGTEMKDWDDEARENARKHLVLASNAIRALMSCGGAF